MKKIEELKEYLLENFVDEKGNLVISGLDLSEFKGDIWREGWIVKGNLKQDSNKVGGDLEQYGNIVEGHLQQRSNKVKGNLYQGNNTLGGDLKRQPNRFDGVLKHWGW